MTSWSRCPSCHPTDVKATACTHQQEMESGNPKGMPSLLHTSLFDETEVSTYKIGLCLHHLSK